jgi:hypothetical protein
MPGLLIYGLIFAYDPVIRFLRRMRMPRIAPKTGRFRAPGLEMA